GEAVVERGHFLVDQDFPTGVVDDADVDVLVGQLTAAGGQGVVEAFVGPIDVGGHGQIELTLGQWEGDLLLGVGQQQLVGAHGSHEFGGTIGHGHPVEVVDDLFPVHAVQVVRGQELGLIGGTGRWAGRGAIGSRDVCVASRHR